METGEGGGGSGIPVQANTRYISHHRVLRLYPLFEEITEVGSGEEKQFALPRQVFLLLAAAGPGDGGPSMVRTCGRRSWEPGIAQLGKPDSGGSRLYPLSFRRCSLPTSGGKLLRWVSWGPFSTRRGFLVGVPRFAVLFWERLGFPFLMGEAVRKTGKRLRKNLRDSH